MAGRLAGPKRRSGSMSIGRDREKCTQHSQPTLVTVIPSSTSLPPLLFASVGTFCHIKFSPSLPCSVPPSLPSLDCRLGDWRSELGLKLRVGSLDNNGSARHEHKTETGNAAGRPAVQRSTEESGRSADGRREDRRRREQGGGERTVHSRRATRSLARPSSVWSESSPSPLLASPAHLWLWAGLCVPVDAECERASDAALRVLRQDFDSPCMTRARTPLGHCVFTVVFTYVYVCSITIHNYTLAL